MDTEVELRFCRLWPPWNTIQFYLSQMYLYVHPFISLTLPVAQPIHPFSYLYLSLLLVLPQINQSMYLSTTTSIHPPSGLPFFSIINPLHPFSERCIYIASPPRQNLLSKLCKSVLTIMICQHEIKVDRSHFHLHYISPIFSPLFLSTHLSLYKSHLINHSNQQIKT